MNLLFKLIRKLFLVKEIISKQGEVHFRRYRLLQTPRGAIYLHQLLKSDEDVHFHDHPWDFISYILKGSYFERWTSYPHHLYEYSSVYSSKAPEPGLKPRRLIKHHAQDTHKITLLTPVVWTLVFVSRRQRDWGYRVSKNVWLNHQDYRRLKNNNQLNNIDQFNV